MSPLFRSKAREEAGGALVSADDTLAILESGRADLGPARRMRERAASLLARGAYREAAQAARKAEETARLLDRLHTAASQGIVRLRAERGRMAKLGMSVEDVDALVASAEAWMSKTVERDGDPAFPAYAKSAELALRGLKLASGRIPRYKEASAAVYESVQALRKMVEANRFVDREAFQFFVLKPANDVLVEAKGKLSANEYGEAKDLARWTIAAAKQIEDTYGRVTAAFTRVDEGLRALRSEGGLARDVENLLALCRTALERGKFDEAADVAERAGRRLEDVREAYRSLVLRRRNAEDAIAEAERWGFDAQEPRAVLKDAVQLMETGRYDDAGPRMDETRRAAQGLRETHKATAARIQAMRTSVAAMRATDRVAAGEAEGLIAKAEALLEEGRYRACDENLQIASLLLVDLEAAGHPAADPGRGFASLLQAARAVQPTCPTCGGPLSNDGTCLTCSTLPEPENVPTVSPIAQAVEGARKVLAEIGREDRALMEAVAASVEACAMCGGPLAGEDVLCGKCQATVRGRG